MKTSIFFLFFLAFSFSAFSQHDFSLKPMPKINFESGVLNADSTYLLFEQDARTPDLETFFESPKETKQVQSSLTYQSKMPIAKPQANNWNMPVLAPDSTVNYAIREKRFEPLKLKEKE